MLDSCIYIPTKNHATINFKSNLSEKSTFQTIYLTDRSIYLDIIIHFAIFV